MSHIIPKFNVEEGEGLATGRSYTGSQVIEFNIEDNANPHCLFYVLNINLGANFGELSRIEGIETTKLLQQNKTYDESGNDNF